MNMAASDLMARLSEAEFQQMIIDRAKLLGWLVYHTHESRRSAPGFPDLVMSRRGRVLFVEVKSQKGKVSEAQQCWLDSLSRCHALEVHVWRPAQFPTIERVLAE